MENSPAAPHTSEVEMARLAHCLKDVALAYVRAHRQWLKDRGTGTGRTRDAELWAYVDVAVSQALEQAYCCSAAREPAITAFRNATAQGLAAPGRAARYEAELVYVEVFTEGQRTRNPALGAAKLLERLGIGVDLKLSLAEALTLARLTETVGNVVAAHRPDAADPGLT